MTSRAAFFTLLALLAGSGCTTDPDLKDSLQETPGAGDSGDPETDPDTGLAEASIVVMPGEGLKTSEAGGTATFTVALSAKPSADVTIALSSSDTKEGTVDRAKLVFTADNWDAPQTVTVTGVDDSAPDGPVTYKIVLAPAVSGDPRYSGLDANDVAVTNADNDSAGITVTPISGLKTSEAGEEATFTVQLNTKPTADVTIALSSSNEKEGTVSPKSLVFTALNWNAPQTVTVTGVDDSAADGAQTYKIVTAPAVSSDKTYSGVDADDVTIVNVDNETAGITVKPTTGLSTTEAGGTATFTIKLNSKPTADVTIPLTSSKPAEGTVSPASIVFTADNWSSPQTVTVTGVDDSVADGNQAYSIVTGAATSTDPGYTGLNADDVAITNVDNESAGFTVSALAGGTTEAGGTATFTVRLNSKPSGTVIVPVSSSNPKEGTVSPETLTFTSENWDAPQTVTITGIDDSVADGSQPFKIVTGAATGTDTTGYVGLNPPDVAASNTDDDSAGFTVSAASGPTTEAGGTATFTVKLNSQPTGTVTFTVATTNFAEGVASTSALTFDAANWNAPQTITVTGQDDSVADGNRPYTIALGVASGTDTSGYVGLNPPDVAMSNTDNDSAGITVTAAPSLSTTEAGSSATFTVKLNSKPIANVMIPLSSSKPAEGTVSPAALVFTPDNWSSPQTVTITGVDDMVADGNQAYSIVTGAATSTDTGYSGLNASDVAVTNTDDETAGFTVTPTTGLTTTEAGGTATFTIRLNSKPTGSVTVGLTSNTTKEGTVSPASVSFTPDNWSAPQTVTVTGADDKIADGSQPYSIITAVATGTDTSGYVGLNPVDVSLSNTDNDSAGFTVSAVSGPTTEAGGTATFTVALNSQPTGNVTIPVSSSDTNEGTVSTSLLTFTALNWSSPQTVTITGKDDAVADGNRPYKVVLGAAGGTDLGYVGRKPADVDLTNTDNDSAGITVSPTTGLTTTEAGGIATFTIKLNSKPLSNVTIPLTSSKTTEGTVSPSSVVFTTDNWNAPQTVTVSGADDMIADGNQAYSIVTGLAVSTDSGYSGMNAADVALTNTDNETAGFTISPTSGLTTSEAGTTATFTIRLNSKPLGNVTVGLTSSNTNEGTVSPASVTFTTDNWNAPQTVTITGVNDAVADGNRPYSIVTAAATGTDTTGYVGMNPANVSVTNTDNDTAGYTVSAVTGPTTEGAGTASFTVKLNSQPTGTVTIPVSSNDTTEGTVSTSSLTFDASNWSSAQSVTITGKDDAVADGNQPYVIVLGAATGTDTTGYVGLKPANVDVSNTDNDSAGITVTVPPGGLTTTEALGTASFTIKLNSEPTAAVTIPLASSNTKEGTISPSSLTFDATNWNVAQTVTLTGVDDFVDDGNQGYFARINAASSTDPAYNTMDPADLSVTNTDNDSVGIVVSPTSGLLTYETGTTDKFTIVLNSAPTYPVTISLQSSNTLEGTVSPSSVTFTAANWNVAQTVTVTGVPDSTYDGNVPFTILTGAASSSDALYNGINPSDVSVTNANVDKPPDCTVSVCGGSCAEIYKRFPKLPSGNYLIQNGLMKYPVTVYCSGMEVGMPADYLNVNSKLNYSGFNAMYGKCATCGTGTVNYFSKVRFYPDTLRLDTTDQTFASGTDAGTSECYKKYGCGGVLNYGSAGSCGDAVGNGYIDITGQPFAFTAAKNYGYGGVSGFSGVMSFTTDRKAARITGGGWCGSYGFFDYSGNHPVANTGVELTYTGP
jgi:large repetitive protein